MTYAQQSLPESQAGVASAETRTLVLHIEGAAPEEIGRGLESAKAIFDGAGITAEIALWAICEIESADDMGWQTAVPREAVKHMHVWEAAEQAAIEACCAGWSSGKPERYALHLFPRPETGLS